MTLQDLLAAGQQALDKGDRETAHELWRSAAVANPYDERVWQALLTILTSDDDRKVCLENIVAINPNNVEARRQLRALKRENRLQPGASEESTETLSADERRQARAIRRERRLREEASANAVITPLAAEPEMELAPLPGARTKRSGARRLVTVIGVILLAIILGLVISVIVYGGILSRVKP